MCKQGECTPDGNPFFRGSECDEYTDCSCRCSVSPLSRAAPFLCSTRHLRSKIIQTMHIKLSGSGEVYVAGLNYFQRPKNCNNTCTCFFSFIVILSVRRPPVEMEYPRYNETQEVPGKRKRIKIGLFKAYMICEKTVLFQIIYMISFSCYNNVPTRIVRFSR